jgi:hypothetical protein
MKKKTILSLGAGVQSSTLALMAAHGEITPMPDVAIFADTGWEPKAVYEWLDWLEKELPYPVQRVSSGNLRDDQIKKNIASFHPASLPYFTRMNGEKSIGMLMRQCTRAYKIDPITKYIRREILGLRPRQQAPKKHVIDIWQGISYDELTRQKVPFVDPWRRNVYPLIERRLTRGHCFEWMAEKGYPKPPRSACLGCPFHSDEEWLSIKNGPADEWEQVIEFDRLIRKTDPKGDLFIHNSCKPINEITFMTAESAGQMSLLDECEGMCGV